MNKKEKERSLKQQLQAIKDAKAVMMQSFATMQNLENQILTQLQNPQPKKHLAGLSQEFQNKLRAKMVQTN